LQVLIFKQQSHVHFRCRWVLTSCLPLS